MFTLSRSAASSLLSRAPHKPGSGLFRFDDDFWPAAGGFPSGATKDLPIIADHPRIEDDNTERRIIRPALPVRERAVDEEMTLVVNIGIGIVTGACSSPQWLQRRTS